MKKWPLILLFAFLLHCQHQDTNERTPLNSEKNTPPEDPSQGSGSSIGDLDPNKSYWDYGTEEPGDKDNLEAPFINETPPWNCSATTEEKTQIYKKFFDSIPAQTGEKIAILMMGPPGVGKSYSRRAILKELAMEEKDFVTIDVDEIRTYLNSYKRAITIANPNYFGKFRAYSDTALWCKGATLPIFDELRKKSKDASKNVIIDGVCKNPDYCEGHVRELIKGGYEGIVIIATFATKRDAITRAKSRSLSTGRWTPPDFIQQVYGDLKTNNTFINLENLITPLAGKKGEARIYDNSGATLKLAYSNKAGVIINNCSFHREACALYNK